NLIAAPGVKLRDIRKAYSHPVALDQCRDFFRKNSRIEASPFYDTAGSVKYVTEKQVKDAAGIAGKQAAAVYKGKILASGIEDDKKNFTRFFVVRRKTAVLASTNKSSLALHLKKFPSALYKALSVFAHRAISISKIE